MERKTTGTGSSAAPARVRLMTFIDDLGVGGTQRWLLHMLKGLARRGYEHRLVVARDITSPFFLAEAQRLAEVHVAGESSLRCGYGLVRIWRSMRNWKPDVVQTALPTSDMIGRILGRLAGVPVIVSSVRGRNADKPAWQRWLDRRTAFIPDRVVVNAREAGQSAIENEGVKQEQIVLIPNGVAAPRPEKSRGAVLASLDIPANAMVIGAVGRLHASKGHGDLISAFASLATDMPGVFLVIAGEGGLRGSLQRQIADLGLAGRIRLPGARDDIGDLLGAIDVFAHPSRWEGMPNALMEAMAAGLPVVASSVDGIKVLVADGVTGLLVAPGATGDLAVKLRTLLLDRTTALELGRKAAARMTEEFELERMFDTYDNLYRSLLKQKIPAGDRKL